MATKLGHWPSPEEMAKELKVSVSVLLEKMAENQRIAELENPDSLNSSLNKETNSDCDDLILLDTIRDKGESPQEIAEKNEIGGKIMECLQILTPKERGVMKLRFGIPGGSSKTLDEVGKAYNLTRERIRQIETTSLRKLRSNKDIIKKLKDFI